MRLTKAAIATILFIVLLPSVFSINQLTGQQEIFFTGTSASPGTLYQDGVGGNANVGLELCDVGPQFAGLTYRLNVAGVDQFVLISYSSSTLALANVNNNIGGGCFTVAPGFLSISPSELTTPNPDVRKAAFPGRLWIGYEGSANPGNINNFVFAGVEARLRGSYSVTRSYLQGSNQVQVSTPQIFFQTTGGTFSKSANDADFGVSSDKRMVVGVCSETTGASCSGGEVLSTPSFPRSYAPGVTPAQVNDQNTYTRYVVINGLDHEICIGANLRSTVNSVLPDPIYYSQTLDILATVNNPRAAPTEIQGGNVEVTTPFDVQVRIFETASPANVVFTTTYTVNSPLVPDGQQQDLTQWLAIAQSGLYTVEVTADINNDIVECNEGDNIATRQFELLPITLPQIRIDGVLTDDFPRANIPYQVDVFMENSDGDILSNATVRIIEENGLNLMAPTQIYNRTTGPGPLDTVQDGLRVKNVLEFNTDFTGNSSFAFIPTYNQLFSPTYAFLQVEDHVGSYALYLEGEQENGQEFRFVEAGELLEKYNFTITNTSAPSSFSQKVLPQQTMTSQVLDFVYQTFTNFLQSS